MKKLSQYVESIQKPNGFVILKPGFCNFENEFLTLLKNNGWKVINKCKCTLTDKQAEALYSMHKDKPFYQSLINYMCSDECLCCLCTKHCDDPIKDMNNLKDKVRKEWGEDNMRNAMHSSDSVENVDRESKICCDKLVESMEDIALLEKDFIFKRWLLEKLNVLLAEEVIAWYQYIIISASLNGPLADKIAKKYLTFAKDEYEDHALWLLKRIHELDGIPMDLLNINLVNQVAKYKAFEPSVDEAFVEVSLRHNIEAEINAIKHYTEVEEATRELDKESNKKLKAILKDEEEHLKELTELLEDVLKAKNQPKE